MSSCETNLGLLSRCFLSVNIRSAALWEFDCNFIDSKFRDQIPVGDKFLDKQSEFYVSHCDGNKLKKTFFKLLKLSNSQYRETSNLKEFMVFDANNSKLRLIIQNILRKWHKFHILKNTLITNFISKTCILYLNYHKGDKILKCLHIIILNLLRYNNLPKSLLRLSKEYKPKFKIVVNKTLKE